MRIYSTIYRPHIFLLACLFILVSCSAPKNVHYIGAILSVTGEAAWLGEPQKKTLELLVKDINSKGGVQGKKVQILYEDSEGKPQVAVNAFIKLAENPKVLAIIGPSRSGSAIAVSELAEKYEIPVFSLAASDKITLDEKGNAKKWVFSLAQKSSDAVSKIFDELTLRKVKTIGLLSGETGFGIDGRQRVREEALRRKMSVVAEEVYLPSDTDMTPQLLSLKKKQPEVVINWSIVPAQALIPKIFTDLNFKAQLFQSHGFGNISYVKAAGSSAEGIIFPGGKILVDGELDPKDPQKSIFTEYRAQYEAAYREPVSTFGGHAHDGFSLVVEALKNGKNTRTTIREHVESLPEFTGVTGVFHFSPADHNGLDKSAFVLIKITNGNFSLFKN